MMKKTKILTLFCLIAIILCGLAFKGFSPTRGQTLNANQQPGSPLIGKPIGTKDSPSSSQAPEHVVYRLFFNHLNALKKRAADVEAHGKSGQALRAHYKDKIGFKDKDADLLDEIAEECARETAKVDAKAQKIIDATRKRFPNGAVASVEQIPPPPPELNQLQRKRDMLVMRARHRLVTELGKQKFQQLDDYLKLNFAREVQPTAIRPKQVAPAGQGGPSGQ